MTKTTTNILTAIARKQLLIPTLETRRSDALDFHEVAVWQLKSALEAAFDAGRNPLLRIAVRTWPADTLR